MTTTIKHQQAISYLESLITVICQLENLVQRLQSSFALLMYLPTIQHHIQELMKNQLFLMLEANLQAMVETDTVDHVLKEEVVKETMFLLTVQMDNTLL